jgi:RNA polymerase sigma-70 factor (ECF subfamily)
VEESPTSEPSSDPDSRAATLGDVLYARPGKRLVPEEEWAALVRRIAAGEQAALYALYDRAQRPAFTLAVRITGSRETAEEVTLDVFHEAWSRAGAYDAKNGTVLGWIMNLARSRSIDRVRFERSKKRLPAGVEIDEPAESPDPRELLELAQRGEVLRAAMAVLTPDERLAIQYAFIAGLTHAEVAARLDQPLGTVKTRIRSGIDKLRRQLHTIGRDL